ncbi:MAG TPA: hypothetical protein QGF58_11475 [Myxococcota bacterium]|nr:hypothetical protein [Myxococcota bacterium]
MASSSRGPDHRPEHPVPREAIERVLASVPDTSFIDWDVASREARRFKFDVSFACGDSEVRWSLNDKGEPSAFRERLETLGLRVTAAFLALSPPGAVQTTASFKYRNGRLDRIGLYFEELDDAELIDAVFALAGHQPPPRPEGWRPVAVCLDIRDDAIVAAKDYWMAEDRPGDFRQVPEVLVDWRDRLPWNPFFENRRYLWGRRVTAGGRGGDKLMWMPESHRPETASLAWQGVDQIRLDLGLAANAHLSALRSGWDFEDYLHPDLVCVDFGEDAKPARLLVYTSVR